MQHAGAIIIIELIRQQYHTHAVSNPFYSTIYGYSTVNDEICDIEIGQDTPWENAVFELIDMIYMYMLDSLSTIVVLYMFTTLHVRV